MALGVNTCLRGFGCRTFPQTYMPSLASPHQAKARQGCHGMAWLGGLYFSLIIYLSFWRPFTRKKERKLCVKFCGHVCVGHGITMMKSFFSCHNQF